MFVIFGWGGAKKILGDGLALLCPNCHNARTWQVIRTSKKATLFFVPVAKWSQKYWMVCPVCSAALELESQEQAQAALAAAIQQNDELKSELLHQLTSRAR
jgi:hypothetical protein